MKKFTRSTVGGAGVCGYNFGRERVYLRGTFAAVAAAAAATAAICRSAAELAESRDAVNVRSFASRWPPAEITTPS